MKKLLITLVIIISCFILTGCAERYWKSEKIVLLGKINCGLDASSDNLSIQLDDGWFTEHSEIVVNYRDSVIIIPLTKVPTNEQFKTIR